MRRVIGASPWTIFRDVPLTPSQCRRLALLNPCGGLDADDLSQGPDNDDYVVGQQRAHFRRGLRVRGLVPELCEQSLRRLGDAARDARRAEED